MDQKDKGTEEKIKKPTPQDPSRETEKLTTKYLKDSYIPEDMEIRRNTKK